MKLIVGLGNPGKSYQNTRHNLGKRLLEQLSLSQTIEFHQKKKFKSWIADSFFWGEQEVVLAYPQTYMNLSGEALGNLVGYYPVQVDRDLLIVVDDVDLPFKEIRLRRKGSAGGHNGLKSINQVLGTTEYARLRLGIGALENVSVPLETYVLDPFTSKEEQLLPGFLELGERACQSWVTESIERAMNLVNGSQ